MAKLFFLIFLFLASVAVKGQNFLPDRPSLTQTALNIPAGSLQIESFMGGSWDQSRSLRRRAFTYNSSLVRYSISNAFELRTGWTLKNENIRSANQTIHQASGFLPLIVGLKTPLLYQTEMGIDMALLAQMELTSIASKDYKKGDVAPSMILAISHHIYSKMRIDYNIGLQWNGENTAPTAIYSTCLHLKITNSLRSFGEFYVTIPKEGRDNYFFDFGLSYLVNATLQIDASLGFGLDSGTGDGFFNFGAAYRIDAKH